MIRLLFALILLYSGVALSAERCSESCSVSFMHIISKPTAYNDKAIIIRGVFSYVDGEAYLYPSSEMMKLQFSENALTLDISGMEDEVLRRLSNKFVFVRATFLSTNVGRHGLTNGLLTDVHIEEIVL